MEKWCGEVVWRSGVERWCREGVWKVVWRGDVEGGVKRCEEV